MVEFHKRYIAVADDPKEHSVIAGAHHDLSNTVPILDEVRAQSVDWLLLFI